MCRENTSFVGNHVGIAPTIKGAAIHPKVRRPSHGITYIADQFEEKLRS